MLAGIQLGELWVGFQEEMFVNKRQIGLSSFGAVRRLEIPLSPVDTRLAMSIILLG